MLVHHHFIIVFTFSDDDGDDDDAHTSMTVTKKDLSYEEEDRSVIYKF